MPWTAAERSVWTQASTVFEVTGIPRLIILDASGQVVNADAGHQVAQDPTGQNFPWAGSKSLRWVMTPSTAQYLDCPQLYHLQCHTYWKAAILLRMTILL